MQTPSFLIGDKQKSAPWRAWVPHAIRLLEQGTVVRRDLFETTGSYAVLRPAERSNDKLHIRFKTENPVKGFRTVELQYMGQSSNTLHLLHDLGMPEGSIRIGRMEDQSEFRARMLYISNVLRSLLEMKRPACTPRQFAEDAATIVRMFHSPSDGRLTTENGQRMHLRSTPTSIIFSGRFNSASRISDTQIKYPRDCELGRAVPILLSATVTDGSLNTIFEPALMSARGSSSPVDAMAAIANMSSLSA